MIPAFFVQTYIRVSSYKQDHIFAYPTKCGFEQASISSRILEKAFLSTPVLTKIHQELSLLKSVLCAAAEIKNRCKSFYRHSKGSTTPTFRKSNRSMTEDWMSISSKSAWKHASSFRANQQENKFVKGVTLIVPRLYEIAKFWGAVKELSFEGDPEQKKM